MLTKVVLFVYYWALFT